MIGLISPDSPSIRPFSFVVGDRTRDLFLPVAVTVTVTGADAGRRVGLGPKQAPHQLSPRLKVFLNWLKMRYRQGAKGR